MTRPTAQRRGPEWTTPIAVGLFTVLAFLPILQNGFVTWDDDRNFLDNPAYRGLGTEQLHWMWTTFHMGHYVPLTWMTLGLDYELWGMDARGYHFTSLLLHAANAVLLYFVARRLLRLAVSSPVNDRSLSLAAALAALLFSVHPLRVESVAWVTERRDVLSGLFCSATLLAWLRSTDENASRRWYWISLGLFVCALLSKATSIALPVVLVLLNIYPLKRRDRRAWLELVPFFALAAATAPLTLVALKPPDQLHTGAKVAVSAYSLAFYLWKTVLPTGLSPLYAMPTSVDPREARFLVSYLVVIGVAIFAWLARKRWPGVTIALLVFFVVILPLLGIVQNGPQIAADRYTYLAGPALAILGGAVLLLVPGNAVRNIGAMVVVLFGALTWRQSLVWRDSLTLWTYVANHDSTSAIAQTALGNIDLGENRLDDAVARFQLALRYDSTYAAAHDNLGIALARQGRPADAAAHYERSLALSPRNRETHNNLGVVEARLGRFDAAIAEYQEALEIDPSYADAQVNWGNALVRLNKPAEAIAHYREAIRLRPSNADAYVNWGVALAQTNHFDEAMDAFRRALAIDPANAEARDYLSKAAALRAPGANPPGTGAR